MLSIKISIALLIFAFLAWIISNLPEEVALRIYEIASFLFGLFGFLFLLSVLALFLYYKIMY